MRHILLYIYLIISLNALGKQNNNTLSSFFSTDRIDMIGVSTDTVKERSSQINLLEYDSNSELKLKQDYLSLNAGNVSIKRGETSPSSNQNYIHTRTFTSNDGISYLDQVQYFDGLGRPMQTVQVGVTRTKNDLVLLQEYDGFGRESNAWLPGVVANNNGAFVLPNVVKEQVIKSYENDAHPFSKPVYEASPLNRVVEQYGPGQAWHNDYSLDKGKALRTYYLTNKGGNDSFSSLVLDEKNTDILSGVYAACDAITLKPGFQFKATDEKSLHLYIDPSQCQEPKMMSNTTPSSAPIIRDEFLVCTNYQIKNEQLLKSSSYKSGELYVTLTSDEDGNYSLEFKDKLGQVVLTRQINNSEKYDTYYVYDDFGNLRYVLPPLAIDRLTNYADTNDLMMQFAYIYKYDHRNRCTKKKLPGADWVYYVYDKADRVIFTQDGEQRKGNKNEWGFSLPDVFGRNVLSGILVSSTIKPGVCDDVVVKAEYTGDTSNSATMGYKITGYTISPQKIYLANYYDNYNYQAKTVANNQVFPKYIFDNKQGAEYNKMYGTETDQTAHKGLLTGSIISQLDDKNTTQFLYSTIYYDNRGRAIQTHSSNHLGGKESEYIAYNFTGQPTKKLHEHIVDNKLTSELYTYDYDHAGRLLTTYHELTVDGNKKARTLLASNSYDELGRLVKSERGNDASKIATDYKYNIRSWTTEINSNSGSTQLFNQKLAYNTAPSGVAMGKAQWGGNISGMTWKVKDESGSRGYRFEYDQLSRLTSANYLDNPQTSSNYTAEYTYDKHGNFATISRYGNASGKEVDKLNFTYQGNQLVNIKDGGVNNMSSNTTDFIDYANGTGVYTYNANGAMAKDTHKGISEINYNSLNLPTNLIIKNRNHDGNINYTYSASGQKLKTVHNINPDPSNMAIMGAGSYASAGTKKIVTDYIGNKVYEEKTLNKVLVDGGYFDIKKNKYFYYLADHLGNNRAVADENGDIIQYTHYYPFGMAFPEAKGKDEQAYKYNGKEQDTRLGLNLYDYSARYLDNGIGRFTSIDPLAEKYYSISPYAYVMNNPLKYIDPTGKEVYIYYVGTGGRVTGHTAIGVKPTGMSRTYYNPAGGKRFGKDFGENDYGFSSSYSEHATIMGYLSQGEYIVKAKLNLPNEVEYELGQIIANAINGNEGPGFWCTGVVYNNIYDAYINAGYSEEDAKKAANKYVSYNIPKKMTAKEMHDAGYTGFELYWADDKGQQYKATSNDLSTDSNRKSAQNMLNNFSTLQEGTYKWDSEKEQWVRQ